MLKLYLGKNGHQKTICTQHQVTHPLNDEMGYAFAVN